MRWVSRVVSAVTLALFVLDAAAPIPNTTLKPRTIADFEAYVNKVEQQVSRRWKGGQQFLAIESSRDQLNNVLHGDLWIQPAVQGNPVSISDGLVHDWIGAVFIPNTSMQKVLGVLQDFDRHHEIYPDVKRSRLLEQSSDHITGCWRVEEKSGLITSVFDIVDETKYQEIAPGKWTCKAYAKQINEIERAGMQQEKKLPVGEGSGFLWRLNAYWGLEARDGGVLAECRTLSLSRSIPAFVAWAVKPFVDAVPRESLVSTLRSTETALAGEKHE